MMQADQQAHLSLNKPEQMRARLTALAQVLDLSGQVVLHESLWEEPAASEVILAGPFRPLSAPGFAEASSDFEPLQSHHSKAATPRAEDVAFLASALGRPDAMVATALEALARRNTGARNS